MTLGFSTIGTTTIGFINSRQLSGLLGVSRQCVSKRISKAKYLVADKEKMVYFPKLDLAISAYKKKKSLTYYHWFFKTSDVQSLITRINNLS
jgi:hypothetical protein